MIKFKEWLAMRLQDTVITEMALERAKAEAKVDGLSKLIYDHIIKVLRWKDDDNYNKHTSDIDNWLFELDSIKLKPLKRRLYNTEYYQWLYEDNFDNDFEDFERYIKKYFKEYSSLDRTEITNEDLYDKIKHIYLNLSNDMSDDKFETIKDYI